jgi:hypothetical protein
VSIGDVRIPDHKAALEGATRTPARLKIGKLGERTGFVDVLSSAAIEAVLAMAVHVVPNAARVGSEAATTVTKLL